MNRAICTRMKRSGALVVLMSSIMGCSIVMPQAGSLAPPQPAKWKSPRQAMVERVVVRDSRLSAPDIVEESLTINVKNLLVQAGYFSDVKVVPEKATNAYHLRLQFDRYAVSRRIHPAYWPVAFITMTFYIWFGGPIVVDDVDLHGELTVEDDNGKVLVRKTEELVSSENRNLYSPRRNFWDGSVERTRVIQSLIDQVMAELQRPGGLS